MEKKIVKFPIASIAMLIYLVFGVLPWFLAYGGFSALPIDDIFYIVGVTFLTAILFAKQRNILLLAPIAVLIVGELLFMFRYSDNSDFAAFLRIISYILLFGIVFFVGKRKDDDCNSIMLFSKLYFLPAVIYLLAIVVECILYFIIPFGEMWRYNFPIILYDCYDSCYDDLIFVIAVFLIGHWVVNPYKKERVIPHNDVAYDTTEKYNDTCIDEGYCGLGKHIILCLFTFGIWNLIWIYRTTKYLNKARDFGYYNPTSKLLLCMFVPFYQIYWLYKHGQKIDVLSKEKNLNNSDMATLCLILGIFIPIVACIVMQDKINAICTSSTCNYKSDKLADIDELTKYKELYDNGTITQEEFEAKKKQLLGL